MEKGKVWMLTEQQERELERIKVDVNSFDYGRKMKAVGDLLVLLGFKQPYEVRSWGR